MATFKASITVCCPFHPSELIQRVSINSHTTQQLYCTECVLQVDDPHILSSNLRSISDLIDTAAAFYQARKDKANISEEVPTDYVEPLSRQAEYVDKLSKHIEEEKKKVTLLFDQLTKDAIKILEDKKHESLSELDQQLFNLRYWYIFLDKQVKKAYPTEENISFLFPTKEDLTTKLQKVSNFTQLMAFVRNIKEDLAEQKSITSRMDSKTYLKMLTEDLVKIENTRPVYKIDHTIIPEVKEALKKAIERSLPQLLFLKSRIPDVAKGRDFQSKIMNASEFDMLKKWMPQGERLNLQLLYRASRDGKTVKSFHDFCDGKGPTITIAKCRFLGSSTDSIIGGYSDKEWNQSGSYSASQKAFLFSITKNVKCMVQNATRAIIGRNNVGPSFGGSDLVILSGDKVNTIKPKCYTDSKMLVEMPNYVGGQAQFDLIDLEVFRVL